MFQGPKGPLPGPGVKDVGLEQAYRDAKLTGKKQENLLVVRRDGDRFAAGAVLLVGAGDKAELTSNVVRRVLGRAASAFPRFGTVATTFPQAVTGKGAVDAVQAAVEGIVLGSYRFDRYKTAASETKPLTRITVLGSARADAKAAREAVKRGQVVAEAVCWARDLVNTPAGDMPPAEIAREAQKMARQVGLRCKVWGKPELEKGGFGGILGVGAGSVNPPRLIELWYKGAGTETPIALTGKGIAFDSGGLSIKDAKGMETMKCDMGGAASILATMKVIALLKPKINVIAAIPSSENMPSGSAAKPGDV
jgi:leucyl aminopeptidase